MSIPIMGVPVSRLSSLIDNGISGQTYFKPLLMAVRDAGCAMMLVPQGRNDFSEHENRTTIFVIGDDMETAKGPHGFHRRSLRRAIGHCVAAVIVACDPVPDAYAAAAAVAAGGKVLMQGDKQINGSVAIVETQPYREREWMDFLKKTQPEISLLLCTTKGQ